MKVRVKLFAVAKQVAGTDEIELELDEPARVGDLRAALAEQLPALSPSLRNMLFAVNAEFARDDAVLNSAHEVACIPPVSGG